MARANQVRRTDHGAVGEGLKKPPAQSTTPRTAPQPAPRKAPQRRAENSKLPLVSVIDDQPTMDLAVETLKEAAELQARHAADSQRLEELKSVLANVSEAFSLPGMRWGNTGFEYRGKRRNKILSKERLLEHGVSPEIVADSYALTKEFIDCRFVPLV